MKRFNLLVLAAAAALVLTSCGKKNTASIQSISGDKVSATLASGGKIELEIAWKWKTATQVGNVSVTGTIYAGEYEVDEGISLKTTKKVNVAASGDKSSGSEKGCKSSAEGASALFALPILFTAAYICKNLRRKIR